MNTEKTVMGLNPCVRWIPHWDGTLTAELTFSRRKSNGDYENYVATFRGLTVQEAACVGANARRAVYDAKQKFVKLADEAYNRIITPGQ